MSSVGKMFSRQGATMEKAFSKVATSSKAGGTEIGPSAADVSGGQAVSYGKSTACSHTQPGRTEKRRTGPTSIPSALKELHN